LQSPEPARPDRDAAIRNFSVVISTFCQLLYHYYYSTLALYTALKEKASGFLNFFRKEVSDNTVRFEDGAGYGWPV
jgi:hypothetical protein